MRNEAHRDLLKVWLYAIAAVLVAAVVAPWLYNMGAALAEVTQGKQTNGVVERMAEVCRKATLGDYFKGAWLVAGGLLLVPLNGWLKVGRVSDGGPPLRFGWAGAGDGLTGFCLSLVLVVGLGLALVQSGAFAWPGETPGLAGAARRWLPWAVGLAAGQEWLFRGLALGVFQRSMGAAAAISMAALLSAMVGFCWLRAGSLVVNPESPWAGFELLRLLAKQMAEPWVLTAGVVPALVFGGLLGYARWRTASLWLPVGLHAGWTFANRLFHDFAKPLKVGATLQDGLLPLVALILAAVVLHFITPRHGDFHYGDD